MTSYKKLENIFNRVSHIKHAMSMLSWDEAVIMPTLGGKIRAETIATLTDLSREILSQKLTVDLVLESEQDTGLSHWERRNLSLMKKKIMVSQAIPADLLEELTKSSILAEQVWRGCRDKNDWETFSPVLERVLALTREYASVRSDVLGMESYDALIDEHSPGMSQAIIDPIFDRLKDQLPGLLVAAEEKQHTRECVEPKGPFDLAKQKELCVSIMKDIGFSFEKGRLDTSHHPFCGDDPDDTRITTNYSRDNFIRSLLGTCHETGHAMYQFNLPKKWLRQPVGGDLGMSVHESQSLLMEMHACRSREFSSFLSPKLESFFGHQEAFSAKNLYHLFTRVKRDYIRIDADEVTYPFHVILRYELEKDLMNGGLDVKGLPDAWNEKMKHYLGISPGNNYASGVLQDVHWPSGAFGYFPAYNLGALIAAQIFDHASKANSEMMVNIEKGDFVALNDWMNKSIRSHGSLFDINELLLQATGEGLNPQYFLDHIKSRYC